MHRSHRFGWLTSGVLALIALAVLALPMMAAGQTAPGSIRGTIRDVETGDLLDYANVLIKGTTRGTISLGGGLFSFQGLRPGQYTVQVLYLGYAPEEKTVTVASGEATQVAFNMKVVIVETLEAFDVEGTKYMVDVASARSEQKLGQDRLTKYAIDSVEDAVAKQAGIVMRAGEIYVRGGRSGEVSMRIDDVPVDNPLGGRSVSVSNLAFEAVQTVTGGLDAEYGNAMSGIINITTRSGGDHFEGALRYFTDDFGRQDKTYTNYDRLEFGFGGPTPVNKLTYFLSGDAVFSDTENYSLADRPEYKIQLGDATLLKFRRRQANSAKAGLKLAYEFKPGMRLTGEYMGNYSSAEFYAPNWNVSGYAQRIIMMPVVEWIASENAFAFMGRYQAVYYGPWFENMSRLARPAAVLDLRTSSTIRQVAPVLAVRGTDGRTYRVLAQPAFDGFRYPDSRYATVAEDSSYTGFNSADRNRTAKNVSQQLKFVFTHNLTDETFYTVKLSALSFDGNTNVQDKWPWEYNQGGVSSPGPFNSQAELYLAQLDYYTDPLNPLLITTGDYPYYAEEYSRQYIMKFDLTSTRWEGHLVKSGIQVLYNDMESYELVYPALERQNRFTGDWSLGGNSNVFHTFNPEASWYAQDRWEYEGMVVSYGFRWDLFSPGSAAEILLMNDQVNRNVIKYKQQFSPRLSFAFPITDRDGFNFAYGRYIQFPDRNVLFASQDVIGNFGTLGNPNLKAETTISYQAGLVHQFTDYLAGTVALYSRDMYDLISATTVTDEQTGNQIARYINKAYASSRGFEFTLEKRLSNKFEVGVNYTYAFADGVASEQEFGANPEGLEYLPNQEMPLNWDQRHTVNLNFLITEPGLWLASMTFSYGSGFPWTPVDRFNRRQDPLLENSRRLPATYVLDLQGEREVNFYGQNLTLYVQAQNLLNQDMVRAVGMDIYPGMINGASAYTSYLTETGKFGGAFLQDLDGDNLDEFHAINDPRVFEDHRLFRVGIRWQF